MDKKVIKTKDKFYFGFTIRLIIKIIIFCLLLLSSLILVIKSFQKENINFSYIENGNVDYNVYLKENDYYSEKYLPKNMTYIANLIDYISFDYKYSLSSKNNISGRYKCNVKADLMIYPSTDSDSVVFSKKYDLLNNDYVEIVKTKDYVKTQKINLDYNYYNDIATSFKNKYCVDCESKLVIYIYNIVEGFSLNNKINFSSDNYITLEIPISTKQIDISITSNDLDNKETLINKKNKYISNKIMLFTGVVSGILSIVFFVLILNSLSKIYSKQDKYKKFVNKILNQYDRAIVESNYIPNLNEFEVIKLSDFGELLDVRDNLKVPIIYSKINEQKCCFYIRHDKLLYIYYVKSVDL